MYQVVKREGGEIEAALDRWRSGQDQPGGRIFCACRYVAKLLGSRLNGLAKWRAWGACCWGLLLGRRPGWSGTCLVAQWLHSALAGWGLSIAGNNGQRPGCICWPLVCCRLVALVQIWHCQSLLLPKIAQSGSHCFRPSLSLSMTLSLTRPSRIRHCAVSATSWLPEIKGPSRIHSHQAQTRQLTVGTISGPSRETMTHSASARRTNADVEPLSRRTRWAWVGVGSQLSW